MPGFVQHFPLGRESKSSRVPPMRALHRFLDQPAAPPFPNRIRRGLTRIRLTGTSPVSVCKCLSIDDTDRRSRLAENVGVRKTENLFCWVSACERETEVEESFRSSSSQLLPFCRPGEGEKKKIKNQNYQLHVILYHIGAYLGRERPSGSPVRPCALP